MQFQSQADNSGVFTEGNDSNLTGRYGWVEGLVHRSYGIPASIEDLQNDMSATMMRRQSPFDYMSTMEYEGSIIWKIAGCSFIALAKKIIEPVLWTCFQKWVLYQLFVLSKRGTLNVLNGSKLVLCIPKTVEYLLGRYVELLTLNASSVTQLHSNWEAFRQYLISSGHVKDLKRFGRLWITKPIL